MKNAEATTFTAADVAKHNTEQDCWVIIADKVYDVSAFLNEHPGGKKILLREGGKDATAMFDQFHKRDVLNKYANLVIGNVANTKKQQLDQVPRVEKIAGKESMFFGDLVPFGDPAWYQGNYSLFYNDSHRRLRNAMRSFLDKEVRPFITEWDENKYIPRELLRKFGDAGFLPGVIGLWPKKYVGTNIAGNVKVEEWDPFHELIMIDEVCKVGSGGLAWLFCGPYGISLPPIMAFGTQQLKDKVVADCLLGKKGICLAITEPNGGSDVANLKTEARKTADGKHYIVNGEKKWITSGIYADFFTVAVRTGGSGMGGISLLLLERGMPGITTRQMNCTGVWSSGTTYITFEDVQVPVENLIGKENEGFKYIMKNFNHERWAIAVESVRFARVCYEDAFVYAHKRKTFGKPLIENAIIRAKLGNMARQVEGLHSWLECLTYQMKITPKKEAQELLAGPLALLKAHATQVLWYCVTEAANVFGGLGYTRGGQAERIERIYRDARAMIIGGGTEEILIDLGIRQASKHYQPVSKM